MEIKSNCFYSYSFYFNEYLTNRVFKKFNMDMKVRIDYFQTIQNAVCVKYTLQIITKL